MKYKRPIIKKWVIYKTFIQKGQTLNRKVKELPQKVSRLPKVKLLEVKTKGQKRNNQYESQHRFFRNGLRFSG